MGEPGGNGKCRRTRSKNEDTRKEGEKKPGGIKTIGDEQYVVEKGGRKGSSELPFCPKERYGETRRRIDLCAFSGKKLHVVIVVFR